MLKITALRVGSCPEVSVSDGVLLTFLIFVIEGGQNPIVIDSGPRGPETVWARQKLKMERPAAEEPAVALAGIGVDVADVRTVVQTHLHWDHCGNGAIFPAAEFVVQRAEVEYALTATSFDRATFDLVPGAVPWWTAEIPRMRLVDGDVKLAKGVSLLALPGHTPGFQGVLVETARGPHLVAGDTVPTYDHWRGDAGHRHLPGTFTDLVAYDRTLQRIDDLGAEVIPGHDAAVLGKGPF